MGKSLGFGVTMAPARPEMVMDESGPELVSGTCSGFEVLRFWESLFLSVSLFLTHREIRSLPLSLYSSPSLSPVPGLR